MANSLLAALRVVLSADTAAFSTGMSKARREASTSANAIQKSLNGIKSAMGGLAAGITLAAFTAVTQRALEYASSLGELSKQLGVNSRDLQIFNYIASQTGVSQEAMQKGLAKLTLSLSQAEAGSKTVQRAFAAVGVTMDDIKNRTGTVDILAKVADGMEKAGGASRNAAAGAAIMGRGFQKFVPLLEGGSRGINEMADAAERMGLVLSDEQIQSADETADKLAALKQVLEARIAGVVADNAGSIFELANSFASLAAGIARFMAQDPKTAFGLLAALAGLSLGRAFGPIGAAAGAAVGFGVGYTNAPETVASQKERVRAQRDRLQKIRNAKPYAAQQYDLRQGAGALERETAKLRQMSTVGSFAAPAEVATGVPTDFLGGGGGGSRGPRGKSAEQLAAEAERQRKDQLRDAYDIASEERQADMDILRAKQDLATDYTDRSEIALQLLAMEREQEAAALKLSVELGETSAEQAAILTAKQDARHALEKQAIELEAEAERLKHDAALQDQFSDVQRERMEIESSLAQTAAERRVIELDILKLAFDDRRRRLQTIIDTSRDEGEIERARYELAGLGKTQARAERSVRTGTRGPLESYLASLPDTAAKADEALQAVAANGLAQIEDGLVGLLDGTKSLAAAFKDMAASIISDLIRIQVQKMIVGIASSIFGAVGGAGKLWTGGGAMPSAVRVGGGFGNYASIPGFARGGSLRLNTGMPGVDTNLLSYNGVDIARVTRGETVTVSPDGGGGVTLHQNINFSGAVDLATKQEVYRMASMIKPVAMQAVQEASRRR